MKITNYIVQQIYTLGLANDNYSVNIYKYGISTGISILSNLLIILTISFFQNKLLVCFEFFLFFIPLRSVSGGFHFTSKHICSIVSTLIFIIILNCQDFILVNLFVFMILTFFCIVLVFFMPITDNSIRKLDPCDFKNFQLKKNFLCNVYVIVLVILLILGLRVYITPIVSAIILVTLLLSVDFIISKKKYIPLLKQCINIEAYIFIS